MFEDFDSTKTVDGAAQKRLGASVVISGALLVGLAAVTIVLGAQKVVQAREDAVDVTFEEPPPAVEPEPEPEEAPPPEPEPEVADARPLMNREVLEAPEEIPDERPEESNDALAPVDTSGPVDGFLTGVAGGRGSSAPSRSTELARDEPEEHEPEQMAQREDATPATQISGCRAPEMPAAARAQGIADTVITRFKVNADGTVADIQILRGDPIFHDAVRECLASRVYDPARLPDGTAVASPKTQPFRFTLSNL